MNISPVPLAVDIAKFRSQVFDTLLGTTPDSSTTFESALGAALLRQPPVPGSLAVEPASVRGNSTIDGLVATGRNPALADPEAAFRMMTFINNQDVLFKALFSELSKMKSAVAGLEEAGRSLGSITVATGNDSIKASLLAFVDSYNNWIKQVLPDLKSGGLLADELAAQVTIHALEQSIANIFNGANDGLHGLGDLGIAIDPDTRLISVDAARLDAVLAANKQGFVNTVQEFSANFAQAAGLLISENNFIPNHLDNLDRAIKYIADNNAALNFEFGSGEAAQPSARVAEALAAYNQISGS